MSPHTLYIIGNGFDLAHFREEKKGLYRTSYKHFKEFLPVYCDHKKKYEYEIHHFLCKDKCYVYDILSSAAHNDEEWNFFEDSLSRLPIEKILCYAQQLYINQKRKSFYDILVLFQQQFSQDLQDAFEGWVNEIKYDNEKVYSIEENSCFLTFNYSKTLENTYNIDNRRVYHIHSEQSSLDRVHLKYIFGHGRDTQYVSNFVNTNYPMLRDDYKTLFIEHLNSWRKDTTQQIQFFNSHEHIKDIANIRRVIIIGHSLSNVDADYFRAIIEKLPCDAEIINYQYNLKDNLKNVTEKARAISPRIILRDDSLIKLPR